MHRIITLLSLIIPKLFMAQVTPAVQVVIVDSGKYEFKLQAKKDSDTADFSAAYRILSNQVKQDPKNAEFRYFLGYTIDRMNAEDGKSMYKLSLEMSILASEQFEEVNRLEPNYRGEKYLLDPYAKITSIWGSQAEAYLNRKLPDSAKWAFAEGKKRGGFTAPFLEFNRQLLNSCDKNAILITYGDNISIPIWYLQTMENFRTDIIAIDANLVNTIWYPKYLKAERNLKMSLNNAAIDTIDYMKWDPKIITVVNTKDAAQQFSWELRPTYLDKYILKGDRILLDIIDQNLFKRPIYFSNQSDSSYNLFLSRYLRNEGLVERLNLSDLYLPGAGADPAKNLCDYNIDNIRMADIVISSDAIIVLNNFRWAFFNNIVDLLNAEQYDKAKALIKLMTKSFSKYKLPYTSTAIEKYFSAFIQQVDNY